MVNMASFAVMVRGCHGVRAPSCTNRTRPRGQGRAMSWPGFHRPTLQAIGPTEGAGMQDVWTMVHAERAALIDDLGDLRDAQWGEPSLCDGWTVHDVVAHL